MFAFESLEVYSKVKEFNREILELIDSNKLKTYLRDQLGRASLSIRLNIAEGSSRVTRNDKRRFLVIARGSAFECLSILEILKDKRVISDIEFKNFYSSLEQISKMLFAMIKKLE